MCTSHDLASRAIIWKVLLLFYFNPIISVRLGAPNYQNITDLQLIIFRNILWADFGSDFSELAPQGPIDPEDN